MRMLAVALVLGVLGGHVVRAQVSPDSMQSPRRGDWSLSFGVPLTTLSTSSGTIAVWRMVSGRVNLGLNLGVGMNAVQRADEDSVAVLSEFRTSNWDVRVEPAVKWYLRPPHPVAPYLYLAAGPSVEWYRSSRSDGSARSAANRYGLGIAGGLGADWFPVRWLSVGGFAGLRFDATWTQSTPTYWPAVLSTDDTQSLQSFTSTVFVNVYF